MCKPGKPRGGAASSFFGSRAHIFAQSGNILGRRVAEKAAVFSTELRGADVPDVAARRTRVHHGGQHQPPCFLKPQHLLVLQRAHRGDRRLRESGWRSPGYCQNVRRKRREWIGCHRYLLSLAACRDDSDHERAMGIEVGRGRGVCRNLQVFCPFHHTNFRQYAGLASGPSNACCRRLRKQNFPGPGCHRLVHVLYAPPVIGQQKECLAVRPAKHEGKDRRLSSICSRTSPPSRTRTTAHRGASSRRERAPASVV